MSTTPAPNPERRQRQRVALRGTAYLALTGHQPVEVRTVDISIDGVGVVGSANPPAGLTCLIRLAIPVKPRGSTPIEVEAKVTHSVFSQGGGGFLIGLQFVGLSPTATSAIKQFLQS